MKKMLRFDMYGSVEVPGDSPVGALYRSDRGRKVGEIVSQMEASDLRELGTVSAACRLSVALRALVKHGSLFLFHQLAPQHFAHHRFGQGVPELDLPGDFVARQALFAVLAQLVCAERRPGFEHHPGFDRLHLVDIGHTRHAHLRYCRVAGALSAACWAAMVSMGEKGYMEAARKILETAAAIRKGVESIPELHVLGDPLWMIAFASDTLDIYRVLDFMSSRKWSLNGLHRPPAVHIAVTLRHTQLGVADSLH